MRVIRFWVVCLLLTGVVLVSSGFGVVSGSQTSAKPGGVCRVEGKNKFVNGVSLVCKEMVSGRLVWRVVKTSAVTPVLTTNTTAVSLVGAVTVVPSVVSASSASGNAVFTIADMSPDTGVYAVQWVTQGDDFNSYQMMRATSKTITVPYLSCTRSYTLRVFVMAANWLLADGHQTQNVTAHSPTFDLTMPACTNITSSDGVASLSCAQGGVCAVGDTGPGGGIVFYVASANFTSTDSDCNTTCRYLEAATSDLAPGAWCNDATTSLNVTATGIGSGMSNTTSAHTTCTTSGAIKLAADYTNNGKTDWHLPSKDELNELCKYARNTGQAAGGATRCSGGSDATLRGFATGNYLSSSESAATNAWGQGFTSGGQGGTSKALPVNARAVRAFG